MINCFDCYRQGKRCDTRFARRIGKKWFGIRCVPNPTFPPQICYFSNAQCQTDNPGFQCSFTRLPDGSICFYKTNIPTPPTFPIPPYPYPYPYPRKRYPYDDRYKRKRKGRDDDDDDEDDDIAGSDSKTPTKVEEDDDEDQPVVIQQSGGLDSLLGSDLLLPIIAIGGLALLFVVMK